VTSPKARRQSHTHQIPSFTQRLYTLTVPQMPYSTESDGQTP
jgi:hypothetical protein